MNLNKKLSFSLVTLSVLSVLASCSSGNVPSTASINGNVDMSKSAISSSNVRVVSDNISKEHIIIDAGHGVKTNASVTVNINLVDGNGFKTKGNVSGTAQGFASNLNSIEFWLIDAASAPVSTAGATGAFTFPISTVTNGSLHTVTFTNVPDSTNSYYIAAAGFTASTPTSGTNITNVAATASGGLGKAYVSTSSVSVTGEQVSTPTSLTIGLKLLDAIGAQIDGDTTVNDGAPLPGGGVGASAT